MHADYVSTARPIVAVIEADATDRRTLCSLLSSLDADLRDYDSAESYLASNGEALACLITDMALPGMSGLDLLKLLRSEHSAPPVILLGEEQDVRAAVDAMREGAVDFIEKPHADVSILRRVAYLLDHVPTPDVRH
jgi:FixJ family two-component response regulator